jgi:hypothetical protein
MLKFKDKTAQKITIFRKPIFIGFRIFTLGDSGYILNWEYTRLGLTEGILKEKKRVFIFISNSNFSISILLNPT